MEGKCHKTVVDIEGGEYFKTLESIHIMLQVFIGSRFLFKVVVKFNKNFSCLKTHLISHLN